ncbi:unnamed protein product [Amaranthus hypochondriacus]
MKKTFQRRVRPNTQQGGLQDKQSAEAFMAPPPSQPEGVGMPTMTLDQPPATELPGTKEIVHEDPDEGEVGIGTARAIADATSSSSSMVSNSSLTLSNGFNVLNLEHTRSDTVDPSSFIALGADPIGGDD